MSTRQSKVLPVYLFVLASFFCSLLFAQQVIDKKLEEKLKIVEEKLREHEHQLSSIELPELNFEMQQLEVSMQTLQHSLSRLDHIEIPEIDVYIPEIPEIYVEIPDMPDIPPINIDIPEIHVPEINFGYNDVEINFGEFYSDNSWVQFDVFEKLTEDEEIKLSAIRSVGKQRADQAVPVLNKVLEKENQSAFRYEAVRQLRKFLNEEGVLETLAKVAREDENIEVRKKAIYILGKSDDPKAEKYLKEIAER